ncbi:activator of Hsp90 ATPase-like protein [Arcticibacter pallidicorallinus]|uniref:Activator of Hsp90 ATPase-like protein n=1 Tax=Arcticibacter pallidicorallinus TaxID=1259464 RepID=A0A2T0TQK7_9SPHI|nr:SRPBCC domain-containing protein [Arcticibacter pallidicorallinus]PRY48022.1 activator of Hsp90 ATPase-like protein [Arcticibacter pallidicorallinus]
MKTQEYEIIIDAPAKKVWDVLLGKESYPVWTSAFSPTSQVETDWQEGSKALFLDGSGHGMVSEIAANRPYEYISIRHLGTYKDGVEHTGNDKENQWAGAMENYILQESSGNTRLLIELDVVDEYQKQMDEMWPLALKKVKELAENSPS